MSDHGSEEASNFDDGVVDKNDMSDKNPDGDSPEQIIKRENRVIFLIRIVVVLVLISAAVSTAAIVYTVTSQAEQSSFETEFDAVASKIVDSLVADTALKFWMARTLANSISLALELTGLPISQLSIPQSKWERATQEIKFVARSHLVSWSPFLFSDEDRQSFEEYTRTKEFLVGAEKPCFVCNGDPNQIFNNPETFFDIPGFGTYTCETIETAGRRGIIPTENCELNMVITAPYCVCQEIPEGVQVTTNILDMPESVFRIEDGVGPVAEDSGQDLYHPMYQISIINVKEIPVMYNQLSEQVRAEAISDMLESRVPVLSNIFIRDSDFYKNYIGRNGEASSVLYYPVFDEHGEEIVASVSVELLWADFVTAILPEYADMVDVVVNSSCGPRSFTFRYEPASANFLLVGEGDIHDRRFDSMVISSSKAEYEGMVDFLAPSNKVQANLKYCRFSFSVYATADLEGRNLSNEPVHFALITAAIFVFTSLVFVLYDYTVYQRQMKIMASAKRTNEIVSTLFPRNVRERLLQRQNEGGDKIKASYPKNAKGGVASGPTKAITYLDHDDTEGPAFSPEAMFASDPIADLFASATIMFADIAGFTKWSSDREPSQVFRLLETIYQGFDDLAKKFGMFKIETVGDCYVAACGLPDPRPDHAVVSARFAKACLKKFNKVIKDLVETMDDKSGLKFLTSALEARVGLHSGPVTAVSAIEPLYEKIGDLQ